MINADAKEIIFTSGATESNNIAIKGVARFYKMKKNHVITTQTVKKHDNFLVVDCINHFSLGRSTSVFLILAVYLKVKVLKLLTFQSCLVV